MKRISVIFTALVCFMITSCDKALDVDPIGSVTSDEFYTNVNNLRAGLTGIYSALQSDGIANFPLVEAMSDNCISDPNFVADIGSYAAGNDFVASPGRSVETFYSANYVLIQRANLLLDNIDNVTAIDPDERALIEAEARALRAYSYMNLTYFFGDVPLFDTFLDRLSALSIVKSSATDVLAFVIEEFDAAAAVLGNSASNGRLTKQAVLGLKARLMLYEARKGNESWSTALTAIDEAIAEADNGNHALVDTDNPEMDYQSLFTEANEGNAEYIFTISNSTADQGRNFMESYSWSAGVLRAYIHQNLADAYPYADGTLYDPADDTYEGRDPRLSTVVMHEGLTFDGLTYDGTDAGGFVGGNSFNTATNLFMNKFVTTDFVSGWNQGSLDFPILRYADLLLMQAEARNETGGDAYAPLNAVRDRAGLPELSGLTSAALRDAIIFERRLELALEGLRWLDLITLGIADEVINGIQEENENVIRGFTVNRNELLPLPQSELALNPNLAPQNPGYN